ncbi:MAG TPA: 1,4-beta-xylanase, partial [Solibacterales bacterium]|nr:1,4-beta-xylanase [Bryobacterales bacterium]
MKTLLTLALLVISSGISTAQRWSEGKANAWYAKEPWLVGS